MPPRKTKVSSTAAEVAVNKPEWFELYRIMADTSDRIIKGVIKREDIPEDAKELLIAALTIREVREMCWAEGGNLSPTTACFWAKELSEWAAGGVLEVVDIPLTQD